MAGEVFSLTPRKVEPVDTPWRRIGGMFPVPESLPILERLRRYEPASMAGQPPVVWDRAQGCQVHDAWGNMWLDWSSGVLVANAGHSHPRVVAAARDQIDHPLMHTYCFATDVRSQLVEALAGVAPQGLDKVFLLTTGSEATECAIKLMRTRGLAVGGRKKIGIVSFRHGFHGRTLGAQMAGGVEAQSARQRARLEAAQGNFGAARAALRQAGDTAARQGFAGMALEELAAATALVDLAADDVAAAGEWAARHGWRDAPRRASGAIDEWRHGTGRRASLMYVPTRGVGTRARNSNGLIPCVSPLSNVAVRSVTAVPSGTASIWGESSARPGMT